MYDQALGCGVAALQPQRLLSGVDDCGARSILLARRAPSVVSTGVRRTPGTIPRGLLTGPIGLADVSQLGVVSFPIGKMYHDGRLLGSYLKGPTAAEIAQELVARASEIASNAANQRRRGLTVKDEV